MVTRVEEGETERVGGCQCVERMKGRISGESTFGKALRGKRIGDTVIVDAPAGNIEYKVVSIQR